MSEDCHEFDNGTPVGIGTEVACHHCGGTVTPDQAFLCEFINRDGSTYTVVFHKDIGRMCAIRWAAERLENVAGRLEAVLALFKYVNDGRD
jgi:hypothetical protein